MSGFESKAGGSEYGDSVQRPPPKEAYLNARSAFCQVFELLHQPVFLAFIPDNLRMHGLI